MKTLETERTILRAWREDDAADVFGYAASEKVGPMAGWKPHENIEETKAVLKIFRKDDETWAIQLKETGRVIGSVGLHKTQKKMLKESYDFELGYVLSEAYWGRGIVPEAAKRAIHYAFDEAGAQTLIVSRFPFNFQSEKVIRKLGFRFLRAIENSYTRYDGVVLSELVYIMTKADYQTIYG